MVQFNLLPDVKIEYIKARNQKRFVVFISTLVSVAIVAILVVLGSTVFGLQRKSINDLNDDIASASQQLQDTPDLDKILTVQNQLGVLRDLHDNKPVALRLFDYISQVTPAEASISRLNVDFGQNIMTISGSANSLETVNKYTDTLKFTMYNIEGDDQQKNAFSEVVLSTFGRNNEGATYTISLTFDPTIFSELEDITLTVPNIITTRSKTEQPSALFQESETE